MASKALGIAALLLCLNLLCFSLVSSTTGSCSTPSHKPTPKPSPKPSPSPSRPAKCPRDTAKLGSCVNLFGLISQNVGTPPKEPCCSLLGGLGDMEAAVCLCTTIKTNVLGIKLTLPVDLSLLLNYCDKKLPSGFLCQ
ncbi:Bifunctional inhibitor/lipid-transfer protein/seed storage 2S albumin protein [Dioscorea alata]|uniref:Bifunctional inhibitor/lipid-transfer protein/seed storage 2S albumin protein n=1 Tax=Dioscorea alata TaxID=55571 RepID=A0ACB7WIV3_DIOAL|nr:Bifunctional inhibitor/lipid-transfer protein/seed storage 2S albumin protein [Dioscorea alata]